jgi:hypothetical protein
VHEIGLVLIAAIAMSVSLVAICDRIELKIQIMTYKVEELVSKQTKSLKMS